MNKFITSILLVAVTTAVHAVEQVGFDRYQAILDRSPFGVPASTASAGAPAPNWAEQYSFVGLVPDPMSTNKLAIIQDKDRAYLKAEGDTIGEMKIIQIEAADKASKVIVQRGLEKATLRFKDRGAGGPPALAAPQPAAAQPVPSATGGPVPVRRRVPFRRGDQ